MKTAYVRTFHNNNKHYRIVQMRLDYATLSQTNRKHIYVTKILFISNRSVRMFFFVKLQVLLNKHNYCSEMSLCNIISRNPQAKDINHLSIAILMQI